MKPTIHDPPVVRWTLIGIALAFLGIFIVVPLAAVFFEALRKGGGALDITSVRKKPKEWIPDAVWLNVVALSAMDAFRCARPSLSHVSLPDHRAAGCLRPRVEERLMRQAPQRPVE